LLRIRSPARRQVHRLAPAGIAQHFEIRDNEHNLPAEAIEQATARMTQDEQRMRILDLFVVMEGLVYKEFIDQLKPDGHLVRPFPIPHDWPK
jgi:hypothetical protein